MKRFFLFLALTGVMGGAMAQQQPSQIKEILKKIEKAQNIEDNYYDTAYLILETQIRNTNPVDRALWHSFMAEFLYSYYNQEQYDILNRTAIVGEKPQDFKTWDIQTLVGEIIGHYRLSLEPKELLQETDIRSYAVLMDSMRSVEYRPTLYDFLAFRALDFYRSGVDRLPIPLAPFIMNDPDYFSDNAKFIQLPISTTDSVSFQYLALTLMQDITRFHLRSSHALPLMDITLQRLSYVEENIKLGNKKDLYLKALTDLEQRYRNRPGYEDVTFALGEFFYNPDVEFNSDEAAREQPDHKTAIEWYQKSVAYAPNSMSGKNAAERIKSIEQKEVKLYAEPVLIPEKPALISLEYKNCDSVYIRIIPVNTQFKNIKEYSLSNEKYLQELLKLNYLHQLNIPVVNNKDYRKQTADYILPSLPVGEYCIITSTDNLTRKMKPEGYTKTMVKVTNIMMLYRNNSNEFEFFVSNRTTGEPLSKARLTVTITAPGRDDKKLETKTLTTDKDGKATMTISSKDTYLNLMVSIQYQNDVWQYSSQQDYRSIISYYGNRKTERINTQAYLFTDRAIYRPGQTVYYKGIIIEDSLKKYRIKVNEKGKAQLLDANRKKIAENDYITNQYGSFTGSFQIPENTLTGKFMIRVLNTNHTISVEEYKRPQFEITINPPEGTYKLNEKVTVTGNVTAYAGYAIDGANVNYRVTRQTILPLWRGWFPPIRSSNRQEIIQGNTTTDSQGNFSLDFTALPDMTSKSNEQFYTYSVMVDVTDINGETHSQSYDINIGRVSMQITMDVPDEININQSGNAFAVSAVNLNGQPQNATINYEVSLLETPLQYSYDRRNPVPTVHITDRETLIRTFPTVDLEDKNNKEKWNTLETVDQGTFQSGKDSILNFRNFKSWKEGYYKIRMKTRDSFGEEVVMEKIIFIFNDKASKCRAYEPLWLNVDQNTIEPGKTLNIRLGSYLATARIYLEIISNEKILTSEWITLHQGLKSIAYKIEESHLGKLVVNAYIVQDNHVNFRSETINIPYPDKKIEFEWITFRDKMLPGSQEEWKLKIRGANGEKVVGELLCSMYDASLDAFKVNTFALPDLSINTPLRNFNFIYNEFYTPAYYRLLISTNGYMSSRTYYSLDWKLRYYNKNLGYPMYARAAGGDMEELELVTSDNAVIMEDHFVQQKETMVEAGSGDIQIRSNFAETAFFYPQMETDPEGNITLSFTMPESLTKWKLQGVAHTKDLKTGTFERFVQTQKPLMVVPNAPRFFREGDQLVFTAKVVNMSEEALSGSVKLLFLNALDNQPLDIITDGDTRNFTAAKGESRDVSFRITIPSGIEAITYRITASTEAHLFGNNERTSFSDGEERSLPVLSNRMLVTESMTLAINGNQEKTYIFDKMKNSNSSTLRNYKYTLEFTSNPAWYAVLSLPYLMEYPYECNEQIFSRVYANSIASHIVNSSPKIKEVFDTWKNLTPSTFASNLEKNQDLKNIVLEETPWVMDAENESANKQKVGMLFDIQKMAKQNQSAVAKLEKGQNPNGGWPWFAGGISSSYITQHIIAGFGHLETMGIQIGLSRNSLRKAIQYIDSEYTKEYERMKRSQNVKPDQNHLSPTIIHYLYSRTFYSKSQPIAKGSQEMFEYYKGQLRKYWKDQSIYVKALGALALYRAGDETTARNIVADIKSRAQYSEEMGMYWKKEGYGWYWYEAPIERQAILIEAFSIITRDEESVEKMQQWLLKHKQTQNWGTTRATAEACYALLLRGTDLLQTESDATITVGNELIEVSKLPDAEAGTGYFRTSWNEEQMNSSMATVTVDKPSKGVAWGGVYWQYFENLDKITQAQSPLSMQKQLYKVTLNERGETLSPITGRQSLKVGDKVRVRIEIRTDRDMEYIHLKDMRASAFEPVNVMSQNKRQGGLMYYESTRDAATNFFFDYLPKGTYVFEYTMIATQAGQFSNGIGTIQCMYAPEFSAHSDGITIVVEP